MENPYKKGPAVPLDVGALHLTDEKTKVLRVETSDGSCDMYPRYSGYRLTYYGARGFALDEIFSAETYTEAHSVELGPFSHTRIQAVGGFPKALRTVTETTCEERAEHKADAEPCAPKRIRALWQRQGRRYEEVPAEHHEDVIPPAER